MGIYGLNGSKWGWLCVLCGYRPGFGQVLNMVRNTRFLGSKTSYKSGLGRGVQLFWHFSHTETPFRFLAKNAIISPISNLEGLVYSREGPGGVWRG